MAEQLDPKRKSAPTQQAQRGPFGVDRQMSLQPPFEMPQELSVWEPNIEDKLIIISGCKHYVNDCMEKLNMQHVCGKDVVFIMTSIYINDEGSAYTYTQIHVVWQDVVGCVVYKSYLAWPGWVFSQPDQKCIEKPKTFVILLISCFFFDGSHMLCLSTSSPSWHRSWPMFDVYSDGWQLISTRVRTHVVIASITSLFAVGRWLVWVLQHPYLFVVLHYICGN